MDAMFEEGQLVDVAGNSMVQVITRYDLMKPCTDFDHAVMHPALKLNLDSFELRSHSLFRSDLPDGEARNVKVSGFPSPPCFRSRAA
jgi:hypothetical protein